MQLDEFLNARSIAHLQTLQWLWAPAMRRSSSKQELLRILRQCMLSPELVREQHQALPEPQQEFLRGLLRLDGYEGDVEFLIHRLLPPPSTPQAEREVIEDLARRGFVVCTTVKSWNQVESLHATMPQELGDVLAEVLNLDIREPAPMVSLRRFLAELSAEERERLTKSTQPPGDLVPALTRPESIEERIAALPDPAMQRAVRLALEDHAGILPLERFPSLGLDIESVDSPAWRAALESGLLGTFGHLSLLEYGVGDDHDCLVVYQEIVHAHATARGRAGVPLDHTYACGIDFLTDLLAAVDYVRANPSKLTSGGRFFKGVRNQLLPQSALRTTFFMDEDSLLAFKLTVARELGLVEARDDGRLHATRASGAWEARALVAQLRSLLDVLLKLGEAACLQAHFPRLAQAAREVLRASEPGVWYPSHAHAGRVLSRYLMGLLDQSGAPGRHPAASEAAVWRYPRPSDTVAVVAAAAREPLRQALNYAGLIDIGRRGDQAFVAATRLVPIVLGEASLPAPSGRLIIVNPDFEVVLFPEEGHLEFLHRLCAFCEREKSEVTLHLRITQESVQRAVLRGLTAEGMIATLRDQCRAPLPQNVEYSIRNWAERVHPAAVETLHVLELPSVEALEAAIRLPEIAPIVLRRLSPTAVALSIPQLDPKAEEVLKQLGIYLM
jgi:hypothetical protein